MSATETAYLCPVCTAELLRVADDWRVCMADMPIDSVGHTLYVAEAVRSAATRHYENIERQLLAAVEDHRCEHPLRWRLWRRRHRQELTASAAR